VRFMVEVIDPRLGETVYDPACGTGGFLVEAYAHLEKQCRTVADRELLQKQSIFGGEAKPLPYLLAQMNLLLHGLESPQIDPGNSLRFPLKEIGDRDRVDNILTNPPFGGEEERGILSNFPEDKQTSETALLFLQLIMRKLRRTPSPAPAGEGRGEGSFRGGRAGVVVPNGTLFGDGVCARIKEELLKEFNLHTIVRLPNGVFAPYTSIPTNLLFFDRPGPTREIWYYEQPPPEGRSSISSSASSPTPTPARCTSTSTTPASTGRTRARIRRLGSSSVRRRARRWCAMLPTTCRASSWCASTRPCCPTRSSSPPRSTGRAVPWRGVDDCRVAAGSAGGGASPVA
jgi:type I restriction enzyme M protein